MSIKDQIECSEVSQRAGDILSAVLLGREIAKEEQEEQRGLEDAFARDSKPCSSSPPAATLTIKNKGYRLPKVGDRVRVTGDVGASAHCVDYGKEGIIAGGVPMPLNSMEGDSLAIQVIVEIDGAGAPFIDLRDLEPVE